MHLSDKTLKKLRDIINGDENKRYRSGSQLVAFFNKLGFEDVYGQGFPTRSQYTDEHLKEINDTSKIEECIKQEFAPEDFIEQINALDNLIATFNQYLAFDKLKVVRNNDQILFETLENVFIGSSNEKYKSKKDYLDVDLDALMLDHNIDGIVRERIDEVNICIDNNAPLAAVILIGSLLEAILLSTAMKYPRLFNDASSAPKNKSNGKPKKYADWTLNNFIDVATEVGILKQDIKKFSQVVRDFRNYIHPYQQKSEQFTPDKHTAEICLQVLKGVIAQIGEYNTMG